MDFDKANLAVSGKSGLEFPKTAFTIDLLKNYCYNITYQFIQEETLMKNVIATTNAPGAIGPYSQAIETEGFVFTSGHWALTPPPVNLLPAAFRLRPVRLC